MKIYYIVSSLEGGGAEFIIPDLANFLQSLGHEFKVFACIPRDMETARLLEKRRVSYHLLSQNEESRMCSTYRFCKIVKESPPDLIWTSLFRATFDGQVAGLLNHVPVISWKHSMNTHVIKHLKSVLFNRLSQLWVADSNGVAHFLKDRMKVPANRIMTWPLFKKPVSLPMPQKWTGEGIFHIGTMGRLHPVKNFDLMIQAIHHINQHYPEIGKRIRLSIAGAGREETHLRTLIHSLNTNNVELVGFREDVMAYLKTLHLYLQTSRYEGLCIAVHEALAIGLPVIATDVGEMRLAIRENPIGTILEQDSPEKLAEAILDYFHNPEKTCQYGDNARSYIEEHYSQQAFEAAGKAILNRVETELLPRFRK